MSSSVTEQFKITSEIEVGGTGPSVGHFCRADHPDATLSDRRAAVPAWCSHPGERLKLEIFVFCRYYASLQV